MWYNVSGIYDTVGEVLVTLSGGAPVTCSKLIVLNHVVKHKILIWLWHMRIN